MIDLVQLSANIEDSINKGVLFNNAQNPENAKERFICGSACRLIEAYALYKRSSKYCEDFLLSLRNFLIVTESSLFIEKINASKFGDYGLYFQDGKVSCFKNFPKYIDLDINPEESAGSNIIFQSAMGYVKGMGYECRFKTMGPLITTLADFVVKH